MAIRKAMPVTTRPVAAKPVNSRAEEMRSRISKEMRNKIKFGVNMAKTRTAQPVIKNAMPKSMPKIPRTSPNTGSFPKMPSPVTKGIPKSLPKTPKTSPNTGSFPKPINKKIKMPVIGKSKMRY